MSFFGFSHEQDASLTPDRLMRTGGAEPLGRSVSGAPIVTEILRCEEARKRRGRFWVQWVSEATDAQLGLEAVNAQTALIRL